MSEKNVTLTINVQDGDQANSSTTIQTKSLEELQRLLNLAGVRTAGPVGYGFGGYGIFNQDGTAEETPAEQPEMGMGDFGGDMAFGEQEEYKPSADLKVRRPNHRPNNPRFADNSLAEDYGFGLDEQGIVDMYFNFAAVSSHEDAIAEIADELGIKGEEVEEIIKNHVEDFTKKEFSEDFDDYNQVEPKEVPPSKGFKDYLSDLGAEREVQHTEKKFAVKIEWLDSSYNTQFTEITVEAGTSKEAEQKAIADLRTKNGGKLNLIDAEVELSEANELTIDAKTGAIEGPMKDNMDPEVAAHYLSQYPDGILQNDAFEANSFIFLNAFGEWKFYHSVRNSVEEWDWNTDIRDMVDSYNGDERDIKQFLNGFWYEPASDFFPQVFHREGMDMWDRLRNSENQKQLESEVDEAYGYRKDKWQQAAIDRQFKHTAALLPVPGKYSLDQLGDHEYWGDDLKAGKSGYVIMKIDTGDPAKPRLTFCSTWGDPTTHWKAGDTVLTYHDQRGNERPAVVITSFSGPEWNDPKGREAIKKRMAAGGMDPNKKWSTRTFK